MKTSKILFLLSFAVALDIAAVSHIQQSDRLIRKVKTAMLTMTMKPGGPPMPTDLVAVEVLGFTLNGLPIKLDQSFSADDDWLEHLRAKVRNISNKPISTLEIIFALPEAKFEENGQVNTMGFSLEYRAIAEKKVIMPGNEIECSYLPGGAPMKQQITNRTGVTSISLLNYGGNVKVTFADGGLWIGANVPIEIQGTKN